MYVYDWKSIKIQYKNLDVWKVTRKHKKYKLKYTIINVQTLFKSTIYTE